MHMLRQASAESIRLSLASESVLALPCTALSCVSVTQSQSVDVSINGGEEIAEQLPHT